MPGFEAPVNIAYSQANRTASVRIPNNYTASPKAKRIEFRCPDPSSNPYLAFSAILMAGLDGVKNKINDCSPKALKRAHKYIIKKALLDNYLKHMCLLIL